MRISIIPIAQREMFRAARWYDAQRPGLGDRFLDSVQSGFKWLLDYPLLQVEIDEHAPYRRELLDTLPYALIYRVDEDIVCSIAVANLKRRPAYWRRRATT